MNPNDIRLFVYHTFVDKCRPPTADETAAAFGIDREQALQTFQQLAAERMLVLQPETQEIRMAMPFSAVPTAYTVHAGGSAWWAN